MGMCKDPLTVQLNKLGYNLVKLPRVGIEPLDVLGRDGDSLEKLGSITEVWTSTASVPALNGPVPTAGIAGDKSSDIDIGIGLKLLGNALAGLGGGISLPSLSVAFKKAKKMQFKFVNVESTNITPLALGKYLGSGSLDMSNVFAAKYFGNDETQEYIIFDVLKSDSISVVAKTEKGTNVDADVGALSGALNANVKVNVGSAGSSEITFQGAAKVTFAFKLFEVLFVNGKWMPKGAAADDSLSFSLEDDEELPSAEQGRVLSPGGLLKLKM